MLCPCQEAEATGIAYGGAVYHILGRDAVEGAESVVMEEVDAGQEIEKTATTNGIVFTTMAEAGNIDDVTAAEHADLFSPWAYPVNYAAGQIPRYTDGKLYKCLQAHTSQDGLDAGHGGEPVGEHLRPCGGVAGMVPATGRP